MDNDVGGPYAGTLLEGQRTFHLYMNELLVSFASSWGHWFYLDFEPSSAVVEISVAGNVTIAEDRQGVVGFASYNSQTREWLTVEALQASEPVRYSILPQTHHCSMFCPSHWEEIGLEEPPIETLVPDPLP